MVSYVKLLTTFLFSPSAYESFITKLQLPSLESKNSCLTEGYHTDPVRNRRSEGSSEDLQARTCIWYIPVNICTSNTRVAAAAG